MGTEKETAPRGVRTVGELIAMATDIGVRPSALIWLESLEVSDVEQIKGAIRRGLSRKTPVRD